MRIILGNLKRNDKNLQKLLSSEKLHTMIIYLKEIYTRINYKKN